MLRELLRTRGCLQLTPQLSDLLVYIRLFESVAALLYAHVGSLFPLCLHCPLEGRPFRVTILPCFEEIFAYCLESGDQGIAMGRTQIDKEERKSNRLNPIADIPFGTVGVGDVDPYSFLRWNRSDFANEIA